MEKVTVLTFPEQTGKTNKAGKIRFHISHQPVMFEKVSQKVPFRC